MNIEHMLRDENNELCNYTSLTSGFAEIQRTCRCSEWKCKASCKLCCLSFISDYLVRVLLYAKHGLNFYYYYY